MNFSVAASTHIGSKPRNEDAYFIKPQPDGTLFFGVFDGHGDYGQEVAETVRDFFLMSDPKANSTATFAAAEAVAKATIWTRAAAAGKQPTEAADGTLLHSMPWRDYLLRGGTTATTVHITGSTLKVNHVGDTEVMVIDESGQFTILTNDHSTTSIAEYERVTQEATRLPVVEFGHMISHRPVFIKTGDRPGCGFKINPLGGVRICNIRKEWSAYLRGKMPDGFTEGEGLNMLRSIGDFSLKKHGVTGRADTLEHTLKPGKNIVLVASDGLFDNYTYEGLRDIVVAAVKAGSDVQAAVNDIVDEGVSTGFKNFGRTGQDNTTAVLAIVTIPGPALQEPIDGDPDSASISSEPTNEATPDFTAEAFLAATSSRRCTK